MAKNAQMSMYQAVRPPIGFEANYQGQPSSVPIAFPGTPDPLAGSPGYDANLLAGIAVPLGARVLLQIPMIVDLYTSVSTYSYQVLWRTRNHRSFNQQIQNGLKPTDFHLSGEDPGRREVQTGGTAADLFFLPGASDIEIFEQAEPVGTGAAQLTMRQQLYIPTLGASWVQPYLPNGNNGVWQQGVYQYTSDQNCSGPTWFPLWLDAAGDEMMILLYKAPSEGGWDFAGDDQGVSNTYGTNDGNLPNNPNIGILVSTGTMGGG